jgi:hypothetical protein
LSPFYHQKKQAMYWITFFEILMLSLFLPSKEEVILFDVILRDEVVGELKAVKTTTATQTTYHSFTNIRTSFLEKLEVDYTTRVVYREGVMADAKVDISVNGKTFTDTHTKLVDGQYQFYKSGKLKKTLDLPIRYSSVQLIFEEPAQVAKAYSEESGGFFTIEKTDRNIYEKVNSRGKKKHLRIPKPGFEKHRPGCRAGQV